MQAITREAFARALTFAQNDQLVRGGTLPRPTDDALRMVDID